MTTLIGLKKIRTGRSVEEVSRTGTMCVALPTRAQAYKREGEFVGEGLLSN